MVKVYIHPTWDKPDAGEGGIRRVSENQVKYLPEFSIEITKNPDEADVIACHGGDLITRPGIPMVQHGHGLYWSRYSWGQNYEEINKIVIEAMRHAVAHTAPSEWVATSLRRGMLVYPEVIYHGVNMDEWEEVEENEGYILWNKARQDLVSNPDDMNQVAKKLPGRLFKSTFGRKDPNVSVFGKVPYDEMKGIVKKAMVYLATTRETFGINTLEALAAGVPVAGWDWGGTKEIIKNGETGYLATPGNFDELAACIEKCIGERERLSENARTDAQENWRWRPRIQQYANLYKSVALHYSNPRPKISVVVSTFNEDKYLPECLDSIAKQTESDFEAIIVDGAAQENTKKIVSEFAEKDKRFHYRRTKTNLGLTGSRNFGLTHAKALYIRHIDADDRLMPMALELESTALDNDWGIHIVYGHLENINEDGTQVFEENGEVKRSGWPAKNYSWRMQMAHLNQLPSTVMARRSVYEKSGGYRRRMTRCEDADFWCRVTSFGFRAKKITQAVTLQHRMRQDSKGATEWKEHGAEPDWTAWFPWRMGSRSTGKEGYEIMKKLGREVPNYNLVPFGAQGEPPPEHKSWAAHDHAYPVVSIIVTVGPGHEKYLPDALDSIMSQTYTDWECVVVNDTGKEWNTKRYWENPLAGFPWAKYVSTKGNLGTSVARNLGSLEGKGKAFIWLDADDYWFPWLLEKMVASIEKNNGIIYSDIMSLENGSLTLNEYPEFDCKLLADRGCYPGSSVLVPRWVHEIVMQKQQGWDAQIPGWEDWDYQIAAAVHAGACAYRVEEALFIYRLETSINRKAHKNLRGKIIAYIDEKWEEYRKGKKEIMCGCNRKKKAASPVSAGNSSGVAMAQGGGEAVTSDQTVLLEYQGPQQAKFTLRGQVTQTNYKFGRQKGYSQKYVYVEDARLFLTKKMAGGVPEFVIAQAENKTVAPNVMDFLAAP